MGNSTIIELNHDRWDEIFQNETSQKVFLEQIRLQLAHFEYNHKPILGGEVVAGFHRSGEIYDDWIKFKRKHEREYHK